MNLTQIIIGVVALSQGVQHLADLSIQYLYKDEFLVSPARMGLLMGITSIPWVIKPLWGILTDSYPILGSRRKSYIVLFGCVSGMGWVLMSRFGEESISGTVLMLTLISSSVCVCNVVGEALMVEQSSKDASSNVAIFFGFRAFGGLVSAYFSGQLLTVLRKDQIFLINSVFPFAMAGLSLFLKEQQEVIKMSAGDVISTFMHFFRDERIYKYVIYHLRPVILILAFMMAPSSGQIMFYFYTEVLSFSPVFMGQLKFMYCLGTLLAIFIYKNYLKDIEFATIFKVTTCMYFCSYLTTIILVTRYNIQLNINDKFFCLGDSIMLQLVGELNMLPILVFACKICPKNIEATMYAMLMATINFGQLIGGQFGNLILYAMGITEKDFSRLWIYILFTSIFLILPLPWAHLIKINDQVKDQSQKEHQKENPEQKPLLS